jgi:hypothetical protein
VASAATGVKNLVTGEAGRQLGQRAFEITVNNNGGRFNGQWGQVAFNIAGQMAGTHAMAEGGVGIDMATNAPIGGIDRVVRLAGGVSQFAGMAAGAAGMSRTAAGAGSFTNLPGSVAVARASNGIRNAVAQAVAGRMGATVQTPRGLAVQAASSEAQSALIAVRAGRTIYRQGTFEVQETTGAQYWSLLNPASTREYANKMGMPGNPKSAVDWIMGGTLRPSTPAVTRPAPGIGVNSGGTMETVVRPNGIQIDWFHMPDRD